MPGFSVDYTACFELPTPRIVSSSKYTLTQENIMRYSNTTASNAHLLTSEGTADNNDNSNPKDRGAAPLNQHQQKSSSTAFSTSIHYLTNSSRAGPPSIDLEMARVRGSSLGSADTFGSAV